MKPFKFNSFSLKTLAFCGGVAGVAGFFNYQITNLPNYQILSESQIACIKDENKILVIACITA